MTTQVPALSAITFGHASQQQRAQDRTVDQRVPCRRLRRRKRTLVLVDGDFGDADLGHFCSRHDRRRRSATTTCAK